jgi:hypothetical protein
MYLGRSGSSAGSARPRCSPIRVDCLRHPAETTVGYSFAITWLIAWALEKTIGLRVAPHHELAGIDEAEHAETAYEHGRAGGHFATSLPRAHSAGHH